LFEKGGRSSKRKREKEGGDKRESLRFMGGKKISSVKLLCC